MNGLKISIADPLPALPEQANRLLPQRIRSLAAIPVTDSLESPPSADRVVASAPRG